MKVTFYKLLCITVLLNISFAYCDNQNELNSLISEYRSLSPQEKTVETKEKWLTKINKSVSNYSSEDPTLYKAIFLMASINRDIGKYQDAEPLYTAVSQSSHPAVSTRMIAAKEAYMASVSYGQNPEKSIEHLTRLDSLVQEAKSEDVHPLLQNTINIMDDLIFRSEELKGAAFSSYGKFQRKALYDKGYSKQADEILSDSLSKSVIHFEKNLETLKGLSKEDPYNKRLEMLNIDYSASLYRTAQIYSNIAKIAMRNSNDVIANNSHKKAVEKLNTFFEKYPKTKFTQNAGTLLLSEYYQTNPPKDKYPGFVSSIMDKVSPGHEIQTYLRQLALESLNSNKPEDLILGTQLADIVINTEKKWFPEECKGHMEYLWSILIAAECHINLGSGNEAASYVAMLDGMELPGNFLQNRLKYVEYKHRNMYAPVDILILESIADLDSIPNLDSSENRKHVVTTKAKDIFIPRVHKDMKSPYIFDFSSSKLVYVPVNADQEKTNMMLVKKKSGDLVWDNMFIAVRNAKMKITKQEVKRPFLNIKGKYSISYILPEGLKLPYSMICIDSDNNYYLISVRKITEDGVKIGYRGLEENEIEYYLSDNKE